MSDPNQELRVEIRGLMLDPSSNVPIVILRDTQSQLFLPIWIGVFEANAIALRIEGVEPPRPMTHDLLRLLLEQLGAKVEKIVISDLKESTFFAVIHVQQDGRNVGIDARPSDAIALALRTRAPIYVEETVLDNAKTLDFAPEKTDADRLHKWLESLDPDDFEYKM